MKRNEDFSRFKKLIRVRFCSDRLFDVSRLLLLLLLLSGADVFFFFWKHVVLSDRRKRSLYDVGLYDTEEDEVCISFAVWMATWGSIDRLICFLFLIKGYFDFAGEMISLMSQTRREVKLFSLVTLTSLLCMLSVFAHKLMLLVIVACRKSNTVWKSWKQWSMIWSMNSSQNRCSRTSRWIWSLTWTNR